MATNDAVPIVIDNGADSIKAGFGGEDAPKVKFPCLVGQPRSQADLELLGLADKSHYVGEEALSKRGVLSIRRPIERGVITHWDDMEKVWHHTFSELGVAPEEHPVLLTEAPLNPTANREKVTQIMFETFHTPAMYLASQAVLALYASGRVNGIVLDSGCGVTHAVPVHEGYTIHEAIQRLNFAGKDLTEFLVKMIIERGQPLTTRVDYGLFSNVKADHCYVALDYEKEQAASGGASLERSFEVPGDQVVTIKEERFRCPEALFRPSLLGLDDALGIHQAIHASIGRCEEDLRAGLYGNVVLAGGNTLFPGTVERLQRELAALAPTGTAINVQAHQSRVFSAWIGGSILAHLPAFKGMTITKQAYEEAGPGIVHTKCSGRPDSADKE